MIELERHAFHDNQELDIHRLSGLQFGLQFIAVQPRPGKTDQRRWSSLNRSERPRPELLMRLGSRPVQAGPHMGHKSRTLTATGGHSRALNIVG